MRIDLRHIKKRLLKVRHVWPLSLARKVQATFGAAVILVLALALLIPYVWMGKLTTKSLLEAGRSALVRWRPDTGVEDLVAAPGSVRTRVPEDGGGEFTQDRETFLLYQFILGVLQFLIGLFDIAQHVVVLVGQNRQFVAAGDRNTVR